MNYYIHLFCLHCSDKLLVEDRSIVNEIHLLSSDTALPHHCLGTYFQNKRGLFRFELSELCDITVLKAHIRYLSI